MPSVALYLMPSVFSPGTPAIAKAPLLKTKKKLEFAANAARLDDEANVTENTTVHGIARACHPRFCA